MQRKHVYSTLVPDVLAIIAACTDSRPLMELAVALRAVVSGTVFLPPDRMETILRITEDLTNPHWNLQAHVTLRDPIVQYYAKTFWRACMQAVPLTAQIPSRDDVWRARVKAALVQDASLRNHAKLLLQQIRLRVTPAQPANAPVIAANVTPAPKHDKAAMHAMAKKFAEEFVRRREAQKARSAAVSALQPVSNPMQTLEAVREAPSIPSPATPAPRRSRVFRNVAARAQYASNPSILGLGLPPVAPDSFRPGFTLSIPS